jgi:hypothetical protein
LTASRISSISATARRILPIAFAAAVLIAPCRVHADGPAPRDKFVHPGLLHTDQDFERMKTQVNANAEPWKSGWEKLKANRHASLHWKPNPQEAVYRGNDKIHKENFGVLYNDIAAAYACALRWRISGDDAYAEKSIEIMNGWSSTLNHIGGDSDKFLASGIYGYEFANAAEAMRTYPKWAPADFKRFQNMMLTVFFPMNADFLQRHNGAKIDHYWCNWDACNLASALAIGVLCDRRGIYNGAIGYFEHGRGNGAIERAVWAIYPDNLGQVQESGRDQGHNTLDISLLGAFCQMAWNQGDDMYGYDHNRFLAGAEYVAKYNLGENVPYTSYKNSDVTQPTISESSRGATRPCWEMIYNHYAVLKGVPAPYSKLFAEKCRPEGGGGDYGPNSGGFDQLGYGTLAYTLESADKKPGKQSK